MGVEKHLKSQICTTLCGAATFIYVETLYVGV